MLLLSSADFFSKLTFKQNSFRNTIRVSKGLDPDQDWIWVQTVCRDYQKTINFAATKESLKVKKFQDLLLRLNSLLNNISVMYSMFKAHILVFINLNVSLLFISISLSSSNKSSPFIITFSYHNLDITWLQFLVYGIISMSVKMTKGWNFQYMAEFFFFFFCEGNCLLHLLPKTFVWKCGLLITSAANISNAILGAVWSNRVYSVCFWDKICLECNWL